jgi:DNA-binding transcriptional MerR regulator
LLGIPYQLQAREIEQNMADTKTKEKLIYSLSEISRCAKIPQKTIEIWERELYFLNSGHTSKGKKIFRKRDLDIIIRLKEMLEKDGMTLAGAKRKIEKEFKMKGSESVHPERLKKLLFQVKEQLADIAHSLEK